MLLLRAQSIEAWYSVYGKKGENSDTIKEVTSSGETSTLQTGKYTNIQYSINPKPNPKTAFFKKKVDSDPNPTFY